jgi:DNA polymerase elongation subunit (family B)
MYVDALFDRKTDTILVAERVNGVREFVEYRPEHTLYYYHPSGSSRSIFGDPLKKFVTNDMFKFNNELKRLQDKGTQIFESDVNPVFRSLGKHYKGVDSPVLNVAFFDIETDFHKERGFADPKDPFNAVTAITVYFSHTEKMHTLVLKPPTVDTEEAFKICADFEDTELYINEVDLLKRFLEMIDDVDVFTGWNSETYDIPYTVNRIERLLGKEALAALCLWDKLPRERIVMKFNKEYQTFDFPGRPHLDYLELYKKHNPQQLHSYKLDFVSEHEVGANKTKYTGTLDDLYKKDFRLFIEYNRTDVGLLVKIDKKKKFLDLANQVAHDNGVVLRTTMGSVALVEQAILNEIHEMGLVAPNRRVEEEEIEDLSDDTDGFYDDEDDDDGEDDGKKPVVGAYVAVPKVGIQTDIGCIDINSLYPSCIRALNMSPETLAGQFIPTYTDAFINERLAVLPKNKKADAWEGVFFCKEYGLIMDEDTEHPITLEALDGRHITKTGKEWYEFIFNPANHVCITANGTLFKTDKDGIIPALLARWYSQRKEMQKNERKYTDLLKDPDLGEDQRKEYKFLEGFWNQRQQARKILLNSLYGALLNEGLRFYDARLGKSVTLTGRSIVKHMNSKINEIITGVYDYKGDAIFYSDTDSSYFSAYHFRDQYLPLEWNRDNVIDIYDMISDMVNESFPGFMNKAFNTSMERGGVIKGGRELVASKTLFIRKKKYAALMYDKEGDRYDLDGKPGKLKAMGLDLKRADTPSYMQDFLKDILMGVLTDTPIDDLYERTKRFREEFVDKDGWEKGTPKAIKSFSDFLKRFETGDTSKTIPGHVRAGINWNRMCDVYDDRFAMRCTDGTKVIMCALKKNALGMERIAYPIDEPHLPDWFKELPFDHEAMEETIIDKKLDNLIGVLEWDINKTKNFMAEDLFVFE